MPSVSYVGSIPAVIYQSCFIFYPLHFPELLSTTSRAFDVYFTQVKRMIANSIQEQVFPAKKKGDKYARWRDLYPNHRFPPCMTVLRCVKC